MKTTEGNKLIANFLWGKAIWNDESFDPYTRLDVWDVPDDNRGVFWSLSPYYEEIGQQIEGQLFFHSSWDWLMVVVEKIKAILDSEKELFSKYFQGATMHGRWFTLFMPESIQELHGDIVEFIQWYNENK